MPTQIILASGGTAVRRAAHLGLTGRFSVGVKTTGQALVEVSNTPSAMEDPGSATWFPWDAGTVTSNTLRIFQGPVYALRLSSPAGGATFELAETSQQEQGPVSDLAAFGSVEDCLYNSLPLPSANNIGELRFCPDFNGGAYFRSNGISWVQKTPGLTSDAFTEAEVAALQAVVDAPTAAPSSLTSSNAAALNGATLALAAGATLTVADSAWALLTAGLVIQVGQGGSATLAFSGTATKENAAGTSASNVTLLASGVYALTQSPTGTPRFRLCGGQSL